MQLTTRLVILASAIVFSAPNVFSLPINGNAESLFTARDVDYLDIDAREITDFRLAARELIGQYREAREYHDDLDAREGLYARTPFTPPPGATLDSSLKAELDNHSPGSDKKPIHVFAEEAQHQIDEYMKLLKSNTDPKLSDAIKTYYAALDQHRKNSATPTDADKARSKKWTEKLARIKASTNVVADQDIKKIKAEVKILQDILKNPASPQSKAAILQLIDKLQAKP